MQKRTRATGASVLIALGSLLTGLLLLASPAAADPSSQTSGGSEAVNGSVSSGDCLAVNGSVCSGSGVAVNGSTSSGDAVAVNGSTSSGCAAAINGSTASGGECDRAPMVVTPPVHERELERPGVRVHGTTREATVARPTTARGLAFTGSSTGPLTAAAAAALVLGLALVTLTSERRRPVHSS